MDWKIGKSRGKCSTCINEFAAGQEFYSALYDRGSEFERRDFCGACWRQSAGSLKTAEDGSEIRPFSFWRTAVEEARAEKRSIDLDLVRDVFGRLENDEDPTRSKIRYFLSLILMRKRVLRYVQTESDGEKEYMVVSMPRQKVRYRIRNPHLTQGELADVKAELENLLDMELGEPNAETQASPDCDRAGD